MKAWAIARGLDKLPINKLQVTLKHLPKYIKALKLQEKADKQTQLDLDSRKAAKQKDIEDEIDDRPRGSQPRSTAPKAERAAPPPPRIKPMMTIVDSTTGAERHDSPPVADVDDEILSSVAG